MTDSPKLSPADQELAASVQAVLCKKDPSGEYTFTKQEVRDFIAVCVLQLGMGVPPELQNAMASFIEDTGAADAKTDQELAERVAAYFKRVPLNPELVKEFERIGKRRLVLTEEGFKDASGQASAIRSVGGDASLNAPEAKPQKKKARKVSRGIKS